MPSKSSGRIVKAQKFKNSTPHQKNHRWESFSTKISKFNSLQPLRKVRRHDLDDEDFSASTSYFHASLQKWSELNISKSFVSFKQQVRPLSESLPQILHFETRIMDLLAEHIALQDKEGLEPLLDLLTAFAHDLGVRFEKYYARSLDLILAIASRKHDVEVIEWTFGTLAFLFKYLSKLLVPDLRPTFDVLSPLLGKARQPQHIARFAAEALSFLVKKAAAPSHRETALPLFVEHVRDDLFRIIDDRQFTLYKDGIMTMFAEAVKGNDNTVHSAGAAIVTTVVDAMANSNPELENLWCDCACGIMTSIVHHTTVDTFADFESTVLDLIKTKIETANDASCSTFSHLRLLSVIASTRKGSRISDWPQLIQVLLQILQAAAKSGLTGFESNGDFARINFIMPVTLIWHHAPMDALIPHISRLVQMLTREPFMAWFISLCSCFCELNATRFRSLHLNDFQKFVGTHWSQGTNEDVLCVLLPRMTSSGAFPSVGEKDCFRLPQGWQDQIVSKFERLEVSPFPERGPYDKDPSVWRDRCLPKYSALLSILELAAVHPSTNARISELLLRKLKLALRPSTTLASDEVHFIINQGFHAYLRMCKAAGTVDLTLGPLIRAAVPRFARSVGFLQAFCSYRQMLDNGATEKHDGSSSDSSTQEEDLVTNSLIENLASPSHDLRVASLQLLEHVTESTSQSGLLMEVMSEIENTPLAISHVRNIAMSLRRLGQLYQTLEGETWLQQAVPSFVFGMLTVKLSPVWDDAVECLKQIAETKVGEEAVCTIAFRWLDVPSPRWTPPSTDDKTLSRKFVSDFECTSVQRLGQSLNKVLDLAHDHDEILRQHFDEKQRKTELLPTNARSRSLKVFNALPAYAEKRSRQLVPHLLCWGAEDDSLSPPEEDPEEAHSRAATWSLADRKGLLGVFAQFINPRVLYQHEQVYQALLQLMANGDAEVQKMALKAILAWKQEGVKTYKENLEFLLDEARLKNEITVFLQGDNVIKPEHRPELMPVLLRLLYGRTISKKGAASGSGLHATRLAVLRNLSVEDMGSFLEIAVGKLRGVRIVGQSALQKLDEPLMSARKQVGLLNMLSSLITELGTNASLYMETLVNSVLYCLVFACRGLNSSETEADDSEVDGVDKASVASLLKNIRLTGLKCLTSLFQNAQSFQWGPYQNIILEEIIAPRLEKLPAETTQGVSGTLHLLSTWSQLPKAALFLAPHGDTLPSGVLPAVIGCISRDKTKDEVKIYALAIIRSLVKLASAPSVESEFNENIKEELLEPNSRETLVAISSVVRTSGITNDLLEACIETILSLAPLLKDTDDIRNVIQLSTYLLQQPPRRVNPKFKGRILLILESFVSLPSTASDEALMEDVYKTLSSLFSYFKDRENRQALSRALAIVAQGDESLSEVVQLCAALNSFKEGRIDEPDYDKRLGAFSAISKQRDTSLTAKQWLPLLHNLIFFVRDDEEFGILSSNSADGLRRFIQVCADCQQSDLRTQLEGNLQTVVMPAIYSGARELSDTVRREILRVLGYLLTSMPAWDPVADLGGLLTERLEESAEPAFFFNILSPSTARQLEALRTLEQANLTHQMGSHNVGQFFIPLLEHFIYGRTDGSDDHGLGAQATITIGSLALSLHWKHYRSTLTRYISYIGSRPEAQKQTVRLLGRFADALPAAHGRDADDATSMEIDDAAPRGNRTLTATFPSESQLTTDIVDVFLPPLLKHLHEKDESEVSYRVPVGVIIVKLLKLIPSDTMNQKLAGVLTDICHILRSKTTESRDLARDTLVKIAAVLGPSFFGFILRELRGALTKGYQLHVLSYTMHSIMVAVVPSFAPGDLDYCLKQIVTVIMDDIFGVIGQEKDAEGYTNQMKEIKSSKSQDSMELAARNASIGHLIDLVKPLQALLMQKVDLKMVRKIDSLMARITAGLLHNADSNSRDTLVFCYEVIQEVHNSQKPMKEQKLDPRVKKYLVQKGARRSGDRGTTTKHTYKLTRFAFDILRSMLKKYDSLRVPANVSGFLPILGDALLDGEDEVKISAFRLLATIVKVPFADQSGTDIYKVAVKEATKSISMSTSTTTELSQAALKMLAVVLRDRKDVAVKDAAIDMLLGKLKDDLTEPLFRHVTFNFLRSVLDRRVETAATYDTMDYVGTVMITNDDKDTRDLARGAFFQFIREYPQKKARWAKQLNFVVANLKYKREGGRLSVMEIVHLLLTKSSDDFVQEISATCFLPLFLVLANDDSEKCRLAASELIKVIFQKSDKEKTQNFLTLLRSWLDKDDNASVQRLALLIFGHYFEVREDAPKNKKDFKLVYGKVMTVLEPENVAAVDEDLPNTALGVVRVLTSVCPDRILAADSQVLWDNVKLCVTHSEPAVKLSALRLMGMYLSDFAQQNTTKSAGQAMQGSHGLMLDDAGMQELARLALSALSKSYLEAALAPEAAQVLIYLGPRLPASSGLAGAIKSGLEEEEGDANADDEDDAEGKPQGLHFLFWRLSHILRKEVPPVARAIVPKTTAMEVLETVCRRCAKENLRPLLKTVLVPLQQLTDPTIPAPFTSDEIFKTKHEALKTRAQILMDALQKKFGTADYTQELLAVREEVKARRQQRSSKRKIEAIAHPEKYGRDKRKKFEKEKERKKVRSKEQKAMRQTYKSW